MKKLKNIFRSTPKITETSVYEEAGLQNNYNQNPIYIARKDTITNPKTADLKKKFSKLFFFFLFFYNYNIKLDNIKKNGKKVFLKNVFTFDYNIGRLIPGLKLLGFLQSRGGTPGGYRVPW